MSARCKIYAADDDDVDIHTRDADVASSRRERANVRLDIIIECNAASPMMYVTPYAIIDNYILLLLLALFFFFADDITLLLLYTYRAAHAYDIIIADTVRARVAAILMTILLLLYAAIHILLFVIDLLPERHYAAAESQTRRAVAPPRHAPRAPATPQNIERFLFILAMVIIDGCFRQHMIYHARAAQESSRYY